MARERKKEKGREKDVMWKEKLNEKETFERTEANSRDGLGTARTFFRRQTKQTFTYKSVSNESLADICHS